MTFNQSTQAPTDSPKSPLGASKLIAIGALALGAMVLPACGDLDFDFSIGEDGEGDVETRTIELDGDFSAIDLATFITAEIEVDPDAPASLTFATNPNLFNNLEVEVESDRLSISMIDVGNADEARAVIVVPSLSEIEVTGAVSAHVTGIRDDISLAISGASSVEASAADGTTIDNLTAKVSEAADLDADDLQAHNAQIEASGASSVDVNVADEVTGSVSDASSLDVDGDASVDVRVSDAASVD